jgi:hypothetical protein
MGAVCKKYTGCPYLTLADIAAIGAVTGRVKLAHACSASMYTSPMRRRLMMLSHCVAKRCGYDDANNALVYMRNVMVLTGIRIVHTLG